MNYNVVVDEEEFEKFLKWLSPLEKRGVVMLPKNIVRNVRKGCIKRGNNAK